MDQKPKTWLCPICGMEEVPYGTSPCRGQFCDHPPHLTGEAYIKAINKTEDPGIGISEIANQDM